MIRFQECVPDYYIEESRDFQVLCRLYDFTYNALKYNIDSMGSLTNTRFVKDTVLPLTGDKFGIYDKDSYSNRYLLEALPIALKYKGSLKSVNILINAFLDSEEVFDYVTAFHSKDEDSAKEISELLDREVKPYSIVIFLSSYPNMTNLRILNEYLKMVIPSGMIVEYMFGVNIKILEQFKYKEYVFLFFTNLSNDSKKMYIPVVAPEGNPSKNNYYESFDGYYRKSIDTEIDDEKSYYKESRVENPMAKVQDVSLVASKDTKYSGQYPEGKEHTPFMDKVLGIAEGSSIDINSVSIASVSGAPEEDDTV